MNPKNKRYVKNAMGKAIDNKKTYLDAKYDKQDRAIMAEHNAKKKPESVFGKKLGEKLLNRNRGNRPYTKE